MSDASPHEIRGDRRSAALGKLAGGVMKLWALTLRYQIEDRCGITTPGNHAAPVIFALWHNRIFAVPPIWSKTGGNGRRSVVLTSASKDGAILSSAMAFFGLGAVRGSSSRRAVAALIGMKRALKDGQDVCITPDGPRGPRYSFHPGVVKLAESSGAAIVPIHAHFSSAWRLKSWDRLVIPKPFSRVHVIFDEMLVVPAKLGEDAFQDQLTRVQGILRRAIDDL
ncbi:MAG: hypothetical protein RLZZ245_269 [Verrucomicrobiota bacterium]|jgi:lysophospholipid acyltransferase (LPLAT)-like uncharacterized protein